MGWEAPPPSIGGLGGTTNGELFSSAGCASSASQSTALRPYGGMICASKTAFESAIKITARSLYVQAIKITAKSLYVQVLVSLQGVPFPGSSLPG